MFSLFFVVNRQLVWYIRKSKICNVAPCKDYQGNERRNIMTQSTVTLGDLSYTHEASDVESVEQRQIPNNLYSFEAASLRSRNKQRDNIIASESDLLTDKQKYLHTSDIDINEAREQLIRASAAARTAAVRHESAAEACDKASRARKDSEREFAAAQTGYDFAKQKLVTLIEEIARAKDNAQRAVDIAQAEYEAAFASAQIAKTECESAKNQLDAATVEYEQAQKEAQTSAAQRRRGLACAKTAFESAKKEYESLQVKQTRLENKLALTTTAREKAEKNLMLARAEKEEHETKLANMRDELANMHERAYELAQDISFSKANERAERLSEKLLIAKDKLTDIREEHERANNAYHNAKNDEAAARKTYMESIEKCNAIDVSVARAKVHEAKAEVAKARVNIEKVNEDKRAAITNIENAKIAVAQARSAFDAATVTAAKAQSRLSSAGDDLLSSQPQSGNEYDAALAGKMEAFETLNAARAELDAQDRALTHANDVLTDRSREYDNAITQLSDRQDEFENAREALVTARALSRSALDDMLSAGDELRAAEKKTRDKKDISDSYVPTIEKMTDNIEEMLSEFAEVQAELEEKNRANADVSSNLSSIEDKIKTLESESNIIASAFAEAESELTASLEKEAALSSSLACVSDDINDRSERLEEMEHEIENLDKENIEEVAICNATIRSAYETIGEATSKLNFTQRTVLEKNAIAASKKGILSKEETQRENLLVLDVALHEVLDGKRTVLDGATERTVKLDDDIHDFVSKKQDAEEAYELMVDSMKNEQEAKNMLARTYDVYRKAVASEESAQEKYDAAIFAIEKELQLEQELAGAEEKVAKKIKKQNKKLAKKSKKHHKKKETSKKAKKSNKKKKKTNKNASKKKNKRGNKKKHETKKSRKKKTKHTLTKLKEKALELAKKTKKAKKNRKKSRSSKKSNW